MPGDLVGSRPLFVNIIIGIAETLANF